MLSNRYEIIEVLPGSMLPTGSNGRDLRLRGFSRIPADKGLHSGETQGMGLGYVPRFPTKLLSDIEKKNRKNMSAFVEGPTGNISGYYEPSVNPFFIPKSLYISSRALAVSPGASWADRTNNVQWLPFNLDEFNIRMSIK